MTAFMGNRVYSDIVFLTGSSVAASTEQWRCAPFICRSQAEADRIAPFLWQRYWALLAGTENDSTADVMLGGSAAQSLGNKLKAINPAYQHVTFAAGDVDGASPNLAGEWYDMLIGYDPVSGVGHFQSIMHAFPSAGGGMQFATNNTRSSGANMGSGVGVSGPTDNTTFTRAANTLTNFTDTGRLLIPVVVDFERCA